MGDIITFSHKGDFKQTFGFLESVKEVFNSGLLDKYGQMGVNALSAATPKDTGLAASSWYYTIEKTKGSVKIVWSNSDIEDGYNVAILIQYGHATKNGGRVKGIDYINPAMRPIFENMTRDLMKEAGI